MRAYELLLVITTGISLLSIYLSGRKWTSAVRITSTATAALLIIFDLITEGYRWQMVPLYGLVTVIGVATLYAIVQRRKHSGREPLSMKRKIALRGTATLGLLLLAIAGFIFISFPIVRLPKPTGPYAVGTTTLHFTDLTRPETLTDDPDDVRQFSGRVWYPADKPKSTEPLEYQDYQPSVQLISAGGPPEFIFSHYDLLTSNAYLDAPISDDQPSYPALIFSIGFLTLKEDYQIFAEEFASQGYIVLILDTPYESQAVHRSDGSTVNYSDAHAKAYEAHEDDIFPLWKRFWDDDTTATERDAIAHQMLERETFMDTVLRIRVADTQFAVDELQRLNAGQPTSMFAGKLDLSRVGILGHSLGGAVAGQTCLVDDRFKACANLDGFQWGDVVDSAIQQPFMIMYSEQFEGGTDYILNNLQNDTYVLTVDGSTHMNFQDVPFVIPGTKTIGMSGSISATRMYEITNHYLLAFFGKYLNGDEASLLNEPSPPYAEVAFSFRPGHATTSVP